MCVTCGCGEIDLPHDPATALRAIRLEADVLGVNARHAANNRQHFAGHGVTAFNLMSSPGSGKTTLLVATLKALRARQPGRPLAVIEGDQHTALDAERIRACGVPAVQINTGKGCHLDAAMVGAAFAKLPLHDHDHDHDHGHGHGHQHEPEPEPEHGHEHVRGHAAAAKGLQPLLFIENVGNLVCPALWDLGEAAKVVVLSVTDGEDKPLKYPDMFAAARLMLVNKADLLPYVDFDVERCLAHARRVNPDIEVLVVSATRGQGLDSWLGWLEAQAGAGAPAPALAPTTHATPTAPAAAGIGPG
jgi:hydrogenase nickel incorporation protein HypB